MGMSGISKSQVSRLCTEIEPRRMTEKALTAVIQEAYVPESRSRKGG
jgi:hypothetical protein